MKFLHIESAKDHLKTLNELTSDQDVPFEKRLELTRVYGTFKVILENYEELWAALYRNES